MRSKDGACVLRQGFSRGPLLELAKLQGLALNHLHKPSNQSTRFAISSYDENIPCEYQNEATMFLFRGLTLHLNTPSPLKPLKPSKTS